MYKNNKILGLITARGGSKGLPGKNTRPLLGKPLIAWTIDQAISSNYLDKIVVSTDSKDIADVAKLYGAEVPFLRPKYLATDTSTSIDVINHALDYLNEQDQHFEYIVLLEPTSPLRETSDIDSAIEDLINHSFRATSIVAVSKVEVAHPMFCVKLDENNFIGPYEKKLINQIRRQDIPKAYFYAGLIYISKITALKKNQGFNHDETLAYVIPKWKSPEIDDIYDFICIEALLKNKNKLLLE